MWDEPTELIEHKSCILPKQLEGKTGELESYLDSVWESRTLFYDNDPEKPVPKRQPFLRFELSHGRATMKAGQYVGFIQFEGHTIQILPKLFSPGQADIAFRHLLWWLDYGQRVSFPFINLSTGSEPVENFPEALIRYFAKFTHQLISSQPYHQYQEMTESMSYLRGRLNTQSYINASLSRGNWHRLVCDHEPHLFNNRLNQIIKHVTRQLANICSQTNTRQDLERILFVLDEVDDLPCTVQDCDTVQLNRFFQEYESCLDMCRFFLSHQYINRQTDQQSHFCFLVPMDRVYEDFITGVIANQEHVGQLFNEIKPQAKGWLTEQEIFQIQNDLLLTLLDKKSKVVVDTKYKVRKYEVADQKMGISQPDMYQMISYALRRNTREVVLLYPSMYGQEPAQPQTFTVNSGLMDNQPIQIQAIDLTITGEVKTQEEFNQQVVHGPLLTQLTQAFKQSQHQ